MCYLRRVACVRARACMFEYACTCMRDCVHACVCGCVGACVCVCVCVWWSLQTRYVCIFVHMNNTSLSASIGQYGAGHCWLPGCPQQPTWPQTAEMLRQRPYLLPKINTHPTPKASILVIQCTQTRPSGPAPALLSSPAVAAQDNTG